ncbi:MAG: FtsX-like permease family protein [Pseudomonadota bacterium]
MMSTRLIKLFFLGSLKHPLRLVLLVAGIALGVSCVVAIDIAKTSVSRSFELSLADLTSGTTHQIKGSRFEIDHSIFTQVRTGLGIVRSAPVISTHVKVKEMGSRVLTLMGVDPFSETHFRSLKIGDPNGSANQNFSLLLTGENGVFVSKNQARQYGLRHGDTFTLLFGAHQKQTRIAGFLDTDGGSNKMLDGVILADISLAQEILEMGENISRIDLILTDASQAENIRKILPKGAVLVETSRQNSVVRSLSTSFETSLTAFSMLALFMGIFLIYNTVSFSVARQRKRNGILRALGATRSQIFWAVMIEVMIYALAGSVLGVLLGVLLGHGVVKAVCSTVSYMYFVLTVSQVEIVGYTLVKGLLAGMASCVLAAFFPAVTAARIRPITLMQRSASERLLKKRLPMFTLGGLLIIGVALGIIFGFSGSRGSDFIGVFLAFIGYSFLAPVLIFSFISGVLFAGRPFVQGIVRMAMKNIVRSLSRTSVLIAALAVVTSVYIGMDVMTTSFRASIEDWVDGHIGGDVHVFSADQIHPSLDPLLVEAIGNLPEVVDVSAYNIHRIFSRTSGEVHVFSYVRDLSEKHWTWTAAEPEALPQLLDQGWIYVSEIFARQNNIVPNPSASVVLETEQGPVAFKIAGIFRDFFMGGGRVIVSRKVMTAFWGHDDVTALQVFLAPGTRVNPIIDRINGFIPEAAMVRVVSGTSIKHSIMKVFDRTFIITSALQILTAIVALTGILNSFMALLLERTREMGILRACGAERHQVFRLLLWECAGCGFAAGMMALPLGAWLAWILVHVVNLWSFGWTYEMVVSPGIFVQALLLASVSAVAAGVFPGISAGKTDIGQALHME